MPQAADRGEIRGYEPTKKRSSELPRGRSRQSNGSRAGSRSNPKVVKPAPKQETAHTGLIPRQSRLNTSSSNTTLRGSKLAERASQNPSKARKNQTVTISDCEPRPPSTLSSKQTTRAFRKKSSVLQEQSRATSRLSQGARGERRVSRGGNRSVSQQKPQSKSRP